LLLSEGKNQSPSEYIGMLVITRETINCLNRTETICLLILGTKLILGHY